MTAPLTFRSLTVALALILATESALGQGLTLTRRRLDATPARSATLGTTIVLSVQGAAQGARYRFVATMTATSSGTRSNPTSCAQTHSTIGIGSRVTWQPRSGTYRLTAYGPVGRSETDSLSLTYVVHPRRAMLASSQTPAQNGSVHLTLRTDDLGPGHTYQWWMQYRGQPVSTGGGTYGPPPPPQTWTTETNGPMATYPTPIPPPSSITATVSIHRGDPCEIVAAGATL
jgi:hypothetical protein